MMLQPVPMRKIAEKNQGKSNYRLTLHCQCGKEFVHQPGQKNSIPGPNDKPFPQCPQCKNVWIGSEDVQEAPQHEKREKGGQQYFRACMRHGDHFHTVHVGRAYSWRDYMSKMMGMIGEDSIPGLYVEPISREVYKQIKQAHEQVHQHTMASLGSLFMGPQVQPQGMTPNQAFQSMFGGGNPTEAPSAGEQFQAAMAEQNGMHGHYGDGPSIPMKGIVITGNLAHGMPPGVPPQVAQLLGSLMGPGGPLYQGSPGKVKKGKKSKQKK
jgi:hypothetical protein